MRRNPEAPGGDPPDESAGIADWARGAGARLIDDLIDMAVAARFKGVGADVPRTLLPGRRATQIGRSARFLDEAAGTDGVDWRVYARPVDVPEASNYVLQHVFAWAGTPEEITRGAFRAILGREADPAGLALCAGKLRNLDLTTLQLLEILADSEEGAARGQSVLVVRAAR